MFTDRYTAARGDRCTLQDCGYRRFLQIALLGSEETRYRRTGTVRASIKLSVAQKFPAYLSALGQGLVGNTSASSLHNVQKDGSPTDLTIQPFNNYPLQINVSIGALQLIAICDLSINPVFPYASGDCKTAISLLSTSQLGRRPNVAGSRQQGGKGKQRV